MSTYVPEKPCKKGHFLRYESSGACAVCNKANCAAYWVKNKSELSPKKKAHYRSNVEVLRPSARLRSARRRVEQGDLIRQQKNHWSRTVGSKAAVARSRAFAQSWKSKDPEGFKAYFALMAAVRRKRHRYAIPKWLTIEHKERIKAIYREARRMRDFTGIDHHVDHIVPLRGKTVSGLHVPWNLRVITGTENMRKSAQFFDN